MILTTAIADFVDIDMKTRTKKCKNCGNQFTPYTSLQKFCTESDCIRVLVEETKAKEWKKKKAQKKEELMSLQDHIKIAQQVFNKYINLRDKGKPCISCGKTITGRVNASHYFNANNHWAVRFDEDNVHSSCITCNQYLSGNLIEYGQRLVVKIGQERYERLCAEAKKTRKYSIDELKEIVILYKQKIKDYEKKAERP
jgi:hypothetical protein